MYKSINTSVLHDEKLSLKAKGLLAYLLIMPNGWKGQIYNIVNSHPDGERSVQSAMKELVDNGYAKLKHVYSKEERKFKGCHYEILDQKKQSN